MTDETAHATASHHPDTAHESSAHRTYIVIYVALLVLLILTVAVAMVDLGAWSPVIAMAIALVKAALVAVFFMHLNHAPNVVRVFAAAGLLWLLLLFTLVSDYIAGNAVTSGT